MEAPLRKHLQLVLRTFKPHYAAWNGLRSYSHYPKTYSDAVVGKKDVDKMFEEKSEIELRVMSFKPAKSDKTCSIFYDEDVNKMTNYIMQGGRKELARRLLEDGFTLIKHIQLKKYNKEEDEQKKSEICLDPLKIFHEAIKNVTPKLATKNLKKSGRWYKVPIGIPPRVAKIIGMKWIVEVCRDKGTKDLFYKSFANELILASQMEGRAVNKKNEMHKLCEANRSYAHYRWS